MGVTWVPVVGVTWFETVVDGVPMFGFARNGEVEGWSEADLLLSVEDFKRRSVGPSKPDFGSIDDYLALIPDGWPNHRPVNECNSGLKEKLAASDKRANSLSGLLERERRERSDFLENLTEPLGFEVSSLDEVLGAIRMLCRLRGAQ